MRNDKLVAILILLNLILVGSILFLLGDEMSRARGLSAQTVPHLISYQGMLADGDGVPINGTEDLTITVYISDTGGTPLWQETHNAVNVDDGAFAVLLGENTPLPDDLFNDPSRWLEIEVDGVKLWPRQRFTSGSLVTAIAIWDELSIMAGKTPVILF